MAGTRRDVSIVISAVDQFTDTLAKATAALGSLYGIYKLADEGIKNAREQEDAEAKLAAALGRTSQALIDHASAMQQSTKFSDDMVIKAEAAAAMFLKDEEQIRRVTAAAADFATAYGMDLVSATELLTKSIAGNAGMLSRYGMTVDGAAGSATRLNSVLAQVESHFGGQAAAQAGTFSGSIERLRHAWDDLLEVFGAIIVRNPAVIKAIEILTGGMFNLGSSANQNKIFLREFVRDGLAFIIDVIGKGIGVVGAFHMAWEMMKIGVTSIVAAIGEGLHEFYDVMMQTVLKPLDLLFDALVKIKAIDSNPLKDVQQGLQDFAGAAWENRDAMLAHADSIYNKYDATTKAIYEMADSIRKTDVSQETEPGAGLGGIAEALLQDNSIRAEILLQRYEAEKAMMMAQGQWTEELRQAEMDAFDARQAEQFQKLVDNKANEAELDMAYGTLKLQRAAYLTQQQIRMENMKYQAVQTALANSAAAFQMMAQAGGSHARAWFSMYKAAATAEAVISTYKGAAKAMGDYSYPYNIGVAAAVIAMGFAQVHKIQAQNFDSGAGLAAASLTSAGMPATTPMMGSPDAGQVGGSVPLLGGNQGGQGPVNIHVTINNPLATENWDQIMERDVAPALKRATDRGVTLATA